MVRAMIRGAVAAVIFVTALSSTASARRTFVRWDASIYSGEQDDAGPMRGVFTDGIVYRRDCAPFLGMGNSGEQAAAPLAVIDPPDEPSPRWRLTFGRGLPALDF